MQICAQSQLAFLTIIFTTHIRSKRIQLNRLLHPPLPNPRTPLIILPPHPPRLLPRPINRLDLPHQQRNRNLDIHSLAHIPPPPPQERKTKLTGPYVLLSTLLLAPSGCSPSTQTCPTGTLSSSHKYGRFVCTISPSNATILLTAILSGLCGDQNTTISPRCRPPYRPPQRRSTITRSRVEEEE